jgi:hypothetical protein
VISLAPKPEHICKTHYKKEKLEINIPHKHRCINSQQPVSKSNPTIHKNNYTLQPNKIHSRYTSWLNIQKSIYAIHHINRLEKKNSIISIDTEKHLTKSYTHS